MRALLPALVLIGASLAAFAAGIAAGDRQLFVPPPESAVEGFVRQLATHRYDRARASLSKRATAHHDITDLVALGDSLEAAVGQVWQVEGEPGELSTHRARATARVQGVSGAETAVLCDLVLEHGLWKIDGWAR